MEIDQTPISRIIENAIEKEIARIIISESEEAGKRVEKSIRERVGQISASVLEKFTFQQSGHNLIITVNFENTKSFKRNT